MSYRRRYTSSSDGSTGLMYCGCLIVILLLNLLIGAWSVNYLLSILLHTTIPFWGAAVIGLFGGEITIPAAIVVWVLHVCGVL